jgi:hypothetical protein
MAANSVYHPHDPDFPELRLDSHSTSKRNGAEERDMQAPMTWDKVVFSFLSSIKGMSVVIRHPDPIVVVSRSHRPCFDAWSMTAFTTCSYKPLHRPLAPQDSFPDLIARVHFRFPSLRCISGSLTGRVFTLA